MKKINLQDNFALFNEYWDPKIIGELNDAYIKLVKFKGEFIWHKHDNEDEMFLVVKGEMTIKLDEKDIHLSAGAFFIVPKGIRHCPIAEKEVHVVLIEPKATIKTGDQV